VLTERVLEGWLVGDGWGLILIEIGREIGGVESRAEIGRIQQQRLVER
jgi:hypothetical protein